MPRDDLLARLRAERRLVMAQSRPVVDRARHPHLYALVCALREAPHRARKVSWSGRRWPITHSLSARYACDPETGAILVGHIDI